MSHVGKVELDKNISLIKKPEYKKGKRGSYHYQIFLRKTRIGLADISYSKICLDKIAAYMHDIHITKKHRGKGIGTMVIKHILSDLKKCEITLIYGDLSNLDEKAKLKNFYAKLGFTIIENRIVRFL